MASFIGIDLGTTYSLVSYLDETGRPQIIRNDEGHSLIPSCIEINDKEILVGEEARKGFDWNPKVLARFKRDMGDSVTYKVGEKEFTPTQCSTFILKKLLQMAKDTIEQVGQAVVTIPAHFKDVEREETIKAAKNAKLKIKNIVNEPTAAALYYVFKNGGKLNGIFAVFDLGGGTFDISIIKVVNRDVVVLASEGIKKLGGDDFDTVLQNMVQKKYKDLTGEDLGQKIYTKTNAEDDKKSLTKRERVNVRVEKTNFELTRAEFEKEIKPLLHQTKMSCEIAIEAAGLRLEDIKDVLLVGGSTRVPSVKEMVKEIFKKEPETTVNVDEAVCLGASLFSAIKGDSENLTPVQKASIQNIKITDVSVAYFGTIATNSNTDREFNSILIAKNQKIPCSVTKTYYTRHDNQTAVDCRITQSSTETEDLDEWVNIIANQELSLPSGRKKGQEIDVTYAYDENGTMHASFIDVETGEETYIKKDDLSPDDDDDDPDDYNVD